MVAEARIDLQQADTAELEAELADTLGHHFAKTASTTVAHIGDSTGCLASNGFGVGAAHAIHQGWLTLERDHHVAGDAVPLPVAGQPQHPATDAPVVWSAG